MAILESRIQNFIGKANKVHGNKYNYSKIKYKNSYTKINIICPKHGEFKQLPQHHISGSQCPKCAKISAKKKKTLTCYEFIKKANEIHNDKYDYSKVEYINSHTKVKIICLKHGDFEQIPFDHLKGHGCPQCGRDKSSRGHNQKRSKDFINKANKVHNNKYDYSKVEYINNLSRVIIICPIHGEFEQIANNHLRYGCQQCNIENRTLTTKDFIKKANEIHNNKYDYSKVEYKHNKSTIKIICPKHGEFEQIPNAHLGGKNCRKCAKESIAIAVGDFNRSNTKEFIEKVKKIHNNYYDYSKVEYVDNKTKVKIICPKHGEFEQLACYHIAGSGCHQCAGTHSQNEIFDFVKELGFNSRYNDRTLIKPLELDIYIPDRQIAIEFNGLYWHSFNHKETTKERNRHSIKCDLCQNKNTRLIQINEDEWRNKKDIVKSILKSKLGISNKIYARKCKIKEISSKEHFKFMDQNHIQGGKGCNVAYGLEFEDELVAIMSFNKHNKHEWEITRFANKLDTTIVGGASKLFKCFIRTINPNQILTYADRRYSDGNLYKQLGFKLDGITKSNYVYTKSNYIYSRQQFMKHKLKNKLENFNPALTEAENMFNNGYRRLWDAGNYRFLWK